jgi:hypothetical protein
MPLTSVNLILGASFEFHKKHFLEWRRKADTNDLAFNRADTNNAALDALISIPFHLI